MRKEDTNAQTQTHGENSGSATGHYFEREDGGWRMENDQKWDVVNGWTQNF